MNVTTQEVLTISHLNEIAESGEVRFLEECAKIVVEFYDAIETHEYTIQSAGEISVRVICLFNWNTAMMVILTNDYMVEARECTVCAMKMDKVPAESAFEFQRRVLTAYRDQMMAEAGL